MQKSGHFVKRNVFFVMNLHIPEDFLHPLKVSVFLILGFPADFVRIIPVKKIKKFIHDRREAQKISVFLLFIDGRQFEEAVTHLLLGRTHRNRWKEFLKVNQGNIVKYTCQIGIRYL